MPGLQGPHLYLHHIDLSTGCQVDDRRYILCQVMIGTGGIITLSRCGTCGVGAWPLRESTLCKTAIQYTICLVDARHFIDTGTINLQLNL